MNEEDKEQKLALIQAFFVKSFLISFVLLLFSTLLCMYMYNIQVEFVQKYFSLNAIEYSKILVLLLGTWKILIFQFTFIPAVTIFAMRHCCKCKCDK